jgi:hypothetical protein
MKAKAQVVRVFLIWLLAFGGAEQGAGIIRARTYSPRDRASCGRGCHLGNAGGQLRPDVSSNDPRRKSRRGQ